MYFILSLHCIALYCICGPGIEKYIYIYIDSGDGRGRGGGPAIIAHCRICVIIDLLLLFKEYSSRSQACSIWVVHGFSPQHVR